MVNFLTMAEFLSVVPSPGGFSCQGPERATPMYLKRSIFGGASSQSWAWMRRWLLSCHFSTFTATHKCLTSSVRFGPSRWTWAAFDLRCSRSNSSLCCAGGATILDRVADYLDSSAVFELLGGRLDADFESFFYTILSFSPNVSVVDIGQCHQIGCMHREIYLHVYDYLMSVFEAIYSNA
jgi:hypothetical protein